MKTLGLIGGTTWVSTGDYYKIINREVNKAMGGHHSARLILYSINFHDALRLQQQKDYKAMEALLSDAALALVAAGTDGLVLCANTLHKYADTVSRVTGLPLVHIAEETAVEIKKQKCTTVGLLGTITTMNESFYKDRLKMHGINTLIPEEEEQLFLNHAIYEEFSRDIFKEETRREILRIIEGLNRRGAEGIVLGCTEIPLIIKPGHSTLPLFDTLQIHGRAAARFITG